MTATTPSLPERPVDGSLIEVARILVLVLGAVAVVSTVEVSVVGIAGMLVVGPNIMLSAVWAILLLVAARGIGRRSRRARKAALIAMFGTVLWAALDLALAVFLARRGLELVPVITRIAMPIAVWHILRRPWVRAEFGAKQSRRHRRKAKKPA